MLFLNPEKRNYHSSEILSTVTRITCGNVRKCHGHWLTSVIGYQIELWPVTIFPKLFISPSFLFFSPLHCFMNIKVCKKNDCHAMSLIW